MWELFFPFAVELLYIQYLIELLLQIISKETYQTIKKYEKLGFWCCFLALNDSKAKLYKYSFSELNHAHKNSNLITVFLLHNPIIFPNLDHELTSYLSQWLIIKITKF